MSRRSYSTSLNAMRRGTGGRSSFSGVVATVFGATGFFGRAVVNRLGKMGSQVIIPYRGDDYFATPLKLCGDLGQVLFHPFNLRDETSIRKAMKYSNLVINLIGRDYETKNFKFNDVHVDGARRIARIARETGIKRLIHFSSMGASPKPQPCVLPNGSEFLKSKWYGEQAVLEEFPEAVIFRPSDIYGQLEDRFICYFSHAWRRQLFILPLWKKGDQTFKAPVFYSDLAEGVNKVILDPSIQGQIIQAVGPRKYKLGELMDYIHAMQRKDRKWGYFRYDMDLDPIFKLKVTLTSKIWGFPLANLHWERIERECVSDVVDNELLTLEDLGIQLVRLEDRIAYDAKFYRSHAYYREEIDEFVPPPPPPTY